MGIGLSGMISGLDTDSIVKAMVSAQQTKATKIENKITLNKWTTEAWSGLNTKIYSFYTKYASKLRLQSSYMTRTAKSSDESKVTAKAASTAAVGTHTLQIKKLASSQYVTGAKLAASDTYNKNTKLTEIGTKDAQGNYPDAVKEGTIITITGKKGTDAEKVTRLEVTADTTINDFLNACKESGLSASFDTTQQRFFISSAQSGEEDAFSITTSKLSEGAVTAFDTIQKSVDASALSSTEKTTYDEAINTLRLNTEVISKVLSDDYDESDKIQKKVYDAINTVKDAAVKTQEKRLKDASAETATKEEDKKIEDLLLAAEATPDDAVSYGSNTRSFNDLFNTATQNITEKNTAAAKKAGSEAIAAADFTKEDGKIYATLDFVSTEKYEEAKTTFAEAKDASGNLIADTPEKIAALESQIDSLKDAGTIDAATASALKQAYAVKNTWEAEYTVKDENGAETTTTVGAAYDAAYQESKTATDVTLAADVTAEMVTLVKDDQKDTYTANVDARTQELIAADTTTAEDVKKGIESELLAVPSTMGTSDGGLTALGLGEITGAAVTDGGTNGMAVVSASNAEFVLDGATMEETSNSFTVNGITLNLVSTTENKDNAGTYDSIQITIGKDSDSTYELIKEALTEYNTLIEEMNSLYGADSARGYDPLTSEQKEAMTEEEIKNWEDKIKGSLLRRDETLGSLLSSMRSALASSYTDEETGKTFSLSSYGIVTGNYTENGKLHIYGDEDDSTYATYTDRLKTALEDDPDQVMEVLTNIFGKLYETMTEKCAKTEISSALTFYNDKQYSSLLEDYEDDLDIMNDRIKDLEDKYYKQFTAMETALSKLQSQQNSLASLLGTSTQ